MLMITSYWLISLVLKHERAAKSTLFRHPDVQLAAGHVDFSADVECALLLIGPVCFFTVG